MIALQSNWREESPNTPGVIRSQVAGNTRRTYESRLEVRAETPKAKAKRIPRLILGIAAVVTPQVKRAKSLPVCKAVPIEGCVHNSIFGLSIEPSIGEPHEVTSNCHPRYMIIR